MALLRSLKLFGLASLLLVALLAVSHQSAVADDRSDTALVSADDPSVEQTALPTDAAESSLLQTAFTTSDLWTSTDGATVTESQAPGCRSDGCSIGCNSRCPLMAALEGRETVFGDGNLIDQAFEGALGWKNDLPVPIKAGAWHWYAWDLTGNDAGGYGIPGLRGTYWWEIIADPTWELENGTKVGVHSNLRLRDGDNFRSFFDSKFWFYELYAHVSTDELGTLKGGQIWKRFGLDWDGVFFGNTAYFDGFKLDPDYGVSWEKTTQVDDNLSVDTFAQFFFHEDGVNGSFGGGDAESSGLLTERNTGVVRVVPTWTLCDDAKLSLGLSGLVGQIDSKNSAIIDDHTTSAWAVDATYAKNDWKVFGEVMQSYGVINQARYVSGGDSNRITNFLTGAHYKTGPVLWRASYSLGIDDNPYATDSLVVSGATIDLTKYVDLYIEYVNQQVDNNATGNHVEFFDSLNFIIYWSF